MRKQRVFKPEATEKLREIYAFIRENKVMMHHLSFSLGLSASMVSKYLSGQNKPNVRNFIKLMAWHDKASEELSKTGSIVLIIDPLKAAPKKPSA